MDEEKDTENPAEGPAGDPAEPQIENPADSATGNAAEGSVEQNLDEVAAARIDELKQIIHRNAEQHKETIKTLKETRKTVRRNYHGMVQLLIEVISLGNRYLGGHLKRCAETTWYFCKHMQIPKDVCYLHYYGALLHDIGLVGREAALSETPPEQLTNGQREEYARHPIYGQHIISAIYNLKRTAAIIRAHHERYDGHGFPDKLAGTAIPFGARVVRISNDWDNLLYKYNLKVDAAAESIRSGVGTLYDPKIAEKFLTFAPDWVQNREQEGSRVRIEDLEPGMYLKDDILLSNGLMLVPHGMILDQPTIEKIHSFQSMIDGDHMVSVV